MLKILMLIFYKVINQDPVRNACGFLYDGHAGRYLGGRVRAEGLGGELAIVIPKTEKTITHVAVGGGVYAYLMGGTINDHFFLLLRRGAESPPLSSAGGNRMTSTFYCRWIILCVGIRSLICFFPT